MKLTKEEVALLNMVVGAVTNTTRPSEQPLTQEEITMLKSGKYGDATTFGLPTSVEDILKKL